MRRMALTLTLMTAAGASAQPAPSPGPAPSFAYVRKTTPDKGHAILVQTTTVKEMVPYVERVFLNGVARDVTKYKTVLRFVEVDTIYDLAASRVITPDGKQLAIDEVWKRLQKNTVVAISGNFETPSAAFLRSLNAETLVAIPALPKLEPQPK